MNVLQNIQTLLDKASQGILKASQKNMKILGEEAEIRFKQLTKNTEYFANQSKVLYHKSFEEFTDTLKKHSSDLQGKYQDLVESIDGANAEHEKRQSEIEEKYGTKGAVRRTRDIGISALMSGSMMGQLFMEAKKFVDEDIFNEDPLERKKRKKLEREKMRHEREQMRTMDAFVGVYDPEADQAQIDKLKEEADKKEITKDNKSGNCCCCGDSNGLQRTKAGKLKKQKGKYIKGNQGQLALTSGQQPATISKPKDPVVPILKKMEKNTKMNAKFSQGMKAGLVGALVGALLFFLPFLITGMMDMWDKFKTSAFGTSIIDGFNSLKDTLQLMAFKLGNFGDMMLGKFDGWELQDAKKYEELTKQGMSKGDAISRIKSDILDRRTAKQQATQKELNLRPENVKKEERIQSNLSSSTESARQDKIKALAKLDENKFLDTLMTPGYENITAEEVYKAKGITPKPNTKMSGSKAIINKDKNSALTIQKKKEEHDAKVLQALDKSKSSQANTENNISYGSGNDQSPVNQLLTLRTATGF